MPGQMRLDGTSLDDLLAEAAGILDTARATYNPVGVYALFSGGNDSTVMLDIVRQMGIDGVIHVDTTIGIRATRQFVRDMCDTWGLPLIVQQPPETYAEIVRKRGFFGPKDHPYAYRLLKKSALRLVKKRLLDGHPKGTLMFVTGMRSAESGRRMAHGAHDRLEERIWWINPIRHFTSDDMREYRDRFPDLPHNPVNKALGKSGECLCGCFSYGAVELEIIRDLDPATAAEIEMLQAELVEQGSPFCRWGPGGQGSGRAAGPLCTSCDVNLFGEAA